MKRFLILVSAAFCSIVSFAQSSQNWGPGQIQLAIKKLNVLCSVLYIAAHPDDENTRLISYLANDRLYRTGYLSLTRGDGGQNLIGDEQGIELGLIRTQELLSARRIDGGEQFFSRAYDFGYSKSPQEALTKWGHDKILSDVVWVIRNFKPDVIITRFPTTGEGGHGHHTASAILANEAFAAAADANKFKEQLQYITPWQAKRILWNGFGSSGNATSFTMDVGGYNALLGKSYGEIAALSRSQHKSQGFGASATRGPMLESFKTTGGDAPVKELTDGVDISWKRVGKPGEAIEKLITGIDKNFSPVQPIKSIPALVMLYKELDKIQDAYWREKKKAEVQQIIMHCSGLYIDAYTAAPNAVQTQEIPVQVVVNNRLGADAALKSITIDDFTKTFNEPLTVNNNFNFSRSVAVPVTKEITQPYWLKEKMSESSFNVSRQTMIGEPDVQPAYMAEIVIKVNGADLYFKQPVKYHYNDPVKGEVYQPLAVIPAATVTVSPHLIIFNKNSTNSSAIDLHLHTNADIHGNLIPGLTGIDATEKNTAVPTVEKGRSQTYSFTVPPLQNGQEKRTVTGYVGNKLSADSLRYNLAMRSITYEHIPTIQYFYKDFADVLNIDLKTAGKNIGYIPGAGDKVAEVLERMGYYVTLLDKDKLGTINLSRFDAIITGVRAYNTNEWMDDYYDVLMNYVKEGGNLIVQYNTSNNVGRVKSKIGPYDFEITRNRITDENATVTFLEPENKIFNYPNKISEKDFDGWVQERSIYHAGNWNGNLKPLIAMADPGEAANNGSLVTGKYGKGYFTYTGLVFFRQLPAAVPGAIRLMANLIALNK